MAAPSEHSRKNTYPSAFPSAMAPRPCASKSHRQCAHTPTPALILVPQYVPCPDKSPRVSSSQLRPSGSSPSESASSALNSSLLPPTAALASLISAARNKPPSPAKQSCQNPCQRLWTHLIPSLLRCSKALCDTDGTISSL